MPRVRGIGVYLWPGRGWRLGSEQGSVQTVRVIEHEILSDELPRRVAAVRLQASDDVPAIPGIRDGEPFAPLAALFDPEMRPANVQRLREQLDAMGLHGWGQGCGPGTNVWEDDASALDDLPWLRSPSEAIEQFFCVHGEPFDVTAFPILVFDADDADWREVVESARRELQRTIDFRLHYAAQSGELTDVRKAIADGWPLDALEPDLHWAPVHHAVRGKQSDALQQLLQAGARPDVCDEDCPHTALHFAIEQNFVDGVRLLLEFGADVRLRDDWNRTCADLAEGLGARGKRIRGLLDEHRRRQ